MVQTSEMLVNTWFSKYGMNSISPLEFDDICLYLNGVRQGNDFKVSLKDDEVNISTLENKVLDFVNKDFPLPVSDNINYIIGQAKIFNKPDCMGIGFTMRRVYKMYRLNMAHLVRREIIMIITNMIPAQCFIVKMEIRIQCWHLG